MSNQKIYAGLSCLSMMLLVAGCTPSARDDVGKAGDNLSSATVKSAQGTAQAVDKAGDAVATGTKEAVQGTEKAAVQTGQDIKNGTKEAVQGTEKAVAETGAAVATGTKEAVQGTEKVVAKAGSDVKNSAAVVDLTPKVKAAILRDDSVKMLDLNIDTHSDTKQVVVNGTASSTAMKNAAMADAKKAMADAHTTYKLVDNIKVGAAK
jgi:ElaB/YqjD/DUF883 family membrane-anchored ribosome-binding protein